MKMLMWVGLDVHRSFTRVGTLNPATGEVEDMGQVATREESLIEALERLPDPKTVVLEAGRNSWWVAGTLEPYAARVWVVDPAQVRALQKRSPKTDRRDARALAMWAARGILTPLWHADPETMDLRELTRGKTTLVRLAAKVRHMIRSLCARHGYELPKSDLLGAAGQRALAGVALSGYSAQVLAALVELLPVLQASADSFTAGVQQEAQAYPLARQLQTLPGVGPFLALAMAVEIGDISRFRTRAQLRSYSGLCPRVSGSAGRTHTGPLTKCGNRWLRYAVMLAAQQVPRASFRDRRLKRLYQRVAFHHGRNPAKVACARALLNLAHHLLTEQEDYQARAVPPAATA